MVKSGNLLSTRLQVIAGDLGGQGMVTFLPDFQYARIYVHITMHNDLKGLCPKSSSGRKTALSREIVLGWNLKACRMGSTLHFHDTTHTSFKEQHIFQRTTDYIDM